MLNRKLLNALIRSFVKVVLSAVIFVVACAFLLIFSIFAAKVNISEPPTIFQNVIMIVIIVLSLFAALLGLDKLKNGIKEIFNVFSPKANNADSLNASVKEAVTPEKHG